MNLPEISVKRPVTVTMVFLMVMLVGVISLGRLPQELFPALTYPQLSIVTTYENAAPEEVETLITKIVEEAVGTVSKLKRVSSTSREGTSLVVAEFNWGTKMDFAALAVREKIDLIKERLPQEASDPIVMKFNPFELPIMVLSITGDQHPAELKEFTRKYIKDELEKVEGVASASLSGGMDREILVDLDQSKLRGHNVAVSRVTETIKKSNLNYPAGTIEESFYEYLIRTMGEFKALDDIGNIVVRVEELDRKTRETEDNRRNVFAGQKDRKETSSRFISIKDIGEVKDTYRERTSVSRYNGVENVSLSVLKQAGANTIKVASSVEKAIERLRMDLPNIVNIEIVYDQSKFIKKSINEVRDAAAVGGILVFFVLLFFLRDIKNSIIVTTSIPISVLATFSIMYFMGLTINMMSLMGLALGVGMLVDNGIVVMENIFRLREQGKDIKTSAAEGASEMGNAIFASTLTTVCVFAPMVFVVGVTGQLFKELAVTVIASLLASMAVALSLIPRLVAGGADKVHSSAAKPVVSTSNPFKKVENFYYNAISSLLNKRGITLFVVFMIFVVSMALFPFINKEFMPKVDEGQFVIKLNLPTGSRLEVTDEVSKKIEKILFNTPVVRSVNVNIGSSKSHDSGDVVETLGVHQAQIVVNLNEERDLSTSEVIQQIKPKVEKLNLENGKVEYIAQESIFKAAFQGGSPIVVELKGKELDKLKTGAETVQRALARINGVYGVKTSLSLPHPEIKVNVIKDKAAFYHLSVNDIALSTHIAVKGAIASKFKEGGRETDIRVRLKEEDRKDLVQLRGLLLHSPLDIEVPLKEVAYITKDLGPSEIRRLKQQRAVFVSANVTGRPLNEILVDVDAYLKRFKEEWTRGEKAGEYSVELTGERQQMQESFDSLKSALILSIILIYMIMASQFESFWQPFIIMFTVPLSLIGITWTLFLSSTAISVVVLLGIIILGGIVVNNGIVLIDTINTFTADKVPLFDAVRFASRNRLRPILMTTLTTVLGWIPMAVGGGLMAPMALTVMGGLIVSTFLTLVVIPLIFFSVASKQADKAYGIKTGAEKDDFSVFLIIKKSFQVIVFAFFEFLRITSLFLKGLREILLSSSSDSAAYSGRSAKTARNFWQSEKDENGNKFKAAKSDAGALHKDIDLNIKNRNTWLERIGHIPPPQPQKKDKSDDVPRVNDGTQKIYEMPEKYKYPEIDYGKQYLEKKEPAAEKPAAPETPVKKPAAPKKAVSSEKKKKDGETVLLKPINERQVNALEYLKRFPRLTRKQYSEMFKVSVPTAARDLKDILERGYVIAKGPLGPGRWYELAE